MSGDQGMFSESLRDSYNTAITDISAIREEISLLRFNFSPSGPHLLEYTLAAISRIVQLGSRTIIATDTDEVIVAAMTARGVLETAGIFVEAMTVLSRAKKLSEKERFRAALKRHVFASREFQGESGLKSPHVNDGLRALEARAPGTLELYDVLCETVHPNWAGMGGLGWSSNQNSAVYKRCISTALTTVVAVAECSSTITDCFRGIMSPSSMKGW